MLTTEQLQTRLDYHVEAMEQWATGFLSNTNGPYEPEQVAVMDAQMVVQHAAAAQAYALLLRHQSSSPEGSA